MTRRQRKKQVEKYEIRDFLGFMGYEDVRIRGGERPDAKVRMRNEAGEALYVGVEHTAYHFDASPGGVGGSPRARLDSFWRRVDESIKRRLLARRPRLTVLGQVFLRRGVRVVQSEACALGAALVTFARYVPLVPSKPVTWLDVRTKMAGYRYLGCQIVSTMANIRDRRDHALATRTFPLITKYVRKLTLVNIAPLECFHWRCADVSVACVGINLGHVAACIRQKARENSGYQWGGVEQRWLLICASGWPISSRAGPQPEAAKWDAPELQVACRESGFNRVFFYERVCGWCQPVWPHGQARHRKDTETGMDEAELLL